ncbi:MAG TPA: hypothetical protein VGD14_07980 [bacterium]
MHLKQNSLLLRFSVPKFPVQGSISFQRIAGECSGDAPHYETELKTIISQMDQRKFPAPPSPAKRRRSSFAVALVRF